MVKVESLYELYDWHKPVVAGTCLKLESIDAIDDWAWQDKIYVAEVRLHEVAVRKSNDMEAKIYGQPHEMHDYYYVCVCLVIDHQDRAEYVTFKADDMRWLLEASRLEFPPDPIVWMGVRGGPALVK